MCAIANRAKHLSPVTVYPWPRRIALRLLGGQGTFCLPPSPLSCSLHCEGMVCFCGAPAGRMGFSLYGHRGCLLGLFHAHRCSFQLEGITKRHAPAWNSTQTAGVGNKRGRGATPRNLTEQLWQRADRWKQLEQDGRTRKERWKVWLGCTVGHSMNRLLTLRAKVEGYLVRFCSKTLFYFMF